MVAGCLLSCRLHWAYNWACCYRKCLLYVYRSGPSTHTNADLCFPFHKSGNDILKPKYGTRVLQIRELIAQPVVAAFCAGGVAGAVSRTVVSPLERLKILFQIQSVGREEYKLSVGKGLMKMWKEEGWRGLMRGNGTNCIRIVPYSAVQFGSYNFYKKVSLCCCPEACSALYSSLGSSLEKHNR